MCVHSDGLTEKTMCPLLRPTALFLQRFEQESGACFEVLFEILFKNQDPLLNSYQGPFLKSVGRLPPVVV